MALNSFRSLPEPDKLVFTNINKIPKHITIATKTFVQGDGLRNYSQERIDYYDKKRYPQRVTQVQVDLHGGPKCATKMQVTKVTANLKLAKKANKQF